MPARRLFAKYNGQAALDLPDFAEEKAPEFGKLILSAAAGGALRDDPLKPLPPARSVYKRAFRWAA
jgi:hypothetical protein